MGVWQWLLDSAGLALLLLGLVVVVLVLRRRFISRHGGTFELALHTEPREDSARSRATGWALGIGRYDGGRLLWFRLFTALPRPARVWDRDDLQLTGQREPGGGEASAIFAGHVIVECQTPEGLIELAMSPGALTGFQSWLEAAPPGTDWGRPSAPR